MTNLLRHTGYSKENVFFSHNLYYLDCQASIRYSPLPLADHILTTNNNPAMRLGPNMEDLHHSWEKTRFSRNTLFFILSTRLVSPDSGELEFRGLDLRRAYSFSLRCNYMLYKYILYIKYSNINRLFQHLRLTGLRISVKKKFNWE